jgi:hypothetical protein
MDELLTREEVLGGLPVRRARALLFLIESRSALLAARDQAIEAFRVPPGCEPVTGLPLPILPNGLVPEAPVSGGLVSTHLPFTGGHPLDPAILESVFGVGLAAYFGHFSIGNCARHVLPRDPSARGLIGGCAAAGSTPLGRVR